MQTLPLLSTLDACIAQGMEPPTGAVEHVQEFIQDGRWRGSRPTRMKTPLRRAILDAETAPEKRRLRRQQQVLSDLGHQVREQEVQMLSDGLSSPILPRLTPRVDVFLRAHTTTPATPFSKSRATTGRLDRASEPDQVVNRVETGPLVPPPPPRGPERAFTRVEGLPGSGCLHKSFSAGARSADGDPGEAGRIRFARGVHFANADNRSRLLRSRDINGPVQLHLYTERRPNFRPLVLTAFRSGLRGKDLNRVETFVSSRPAVFAHKSGPKPQMFSTLRQAPPRRDAPAVAERENPISSW